jgi:preprotein translocase subunit SecG
VIYSILIFIHILVCVFLTVAILLQSSKGGGLAGAFGGSNMGAVFGGRGAAPMLSKITVSLAVVFLSLSLILGLMTRGGMTQPTGIVEEERQRRASTPAGVLPSLPTEQGGIGATGVQPPAETGAASETKKEDIK